MVWISKPVSSLLLTDSKYKELIQTENVAPGKYYNAATFKRLSEERRQELNKFVHQLVEDGRIAIRNVRRDGIHRLHDLEKDGHISEDIIKDNESEIQKITDEHIEKLNALQNDKEKEILEV